MKRVLSIFLAVLFVISLAGFSLAGSEEALKPTPTITPPVELPLLLPPSPPPPPKP
ncbi:MAG TPA: hypothetical protein VFF49_09125 [Thermodesulfobacteriota bacterium]|nr:hypothetical protein [Thermodesulfobacteriota bacterium]